MPNTWFISIDDGSSNDLLRTYTIAYSWHITSSMFTIADDIHMKLHEFIWYSESLITLVFLPLHEG